MPAPVETRRKTDTSEGNSATDRPVSLAITPRPRPSISRPGPLVSLSSPSSGSESPAGIRRFQESGTPGSSDSYSTPTALRHQSSTSSNLSQALVAVQGSPYSTNPYLDGALRTGLYPVSNVSPNLNYRSPMQGHGAISQHRGSPPASVPEEPSPFDVTFPPPTNQNKMMRDGFVGNTALRFTTQSPTSGAKKIPYQSQRSILDENMGEEKDIHNPLLSSKPRQRQTGGSDSAGNQVKPAYNFAELEREFL